MTAIVTSKGQITLPAEIRRKMGIRAGQKIEFEFDASGLRVRKVIEEDPFQKARGSLKGAFGKRTVREYLDEMRGPAELPASKPERRRKR